MTVQMLTEAAGSGEFLLYQTEDGRSQVEVRLEQDTVWLTQAQMAELFQSTKQNISLHIRNIFAEGELQPTAVKSIIMCKIPGSYFAVIEVGPL